MINFTYSLSLNASSKQVLHTIGLLIVGTGSMYNLDAAPQWHSHLEHRSSLVLEKTHSSHSHFDVRTPKEHLENIRSILNPSISDLAILLDVSRQSIYKWLSQNSYPELEKFESIKTLSKIADMFSNANIKRAEVLLTMKDASGLSLFELLKAKQPYEEQLKILIAEAKAMEASHDQMRIADSKALSTNDWRSAISIPAYQEEL